MRERSGGTAVSSGEVCGPVWRGRLAGKFGRTECCAGPEGETLLDGLQRGGGQIEAAVGAYSGAETDLFHGGNDGAGNDRGSGGGKRGSCGVCVLRRCAGCGCRGGEAGDGARTHQRLSNGIAREIVHELRAAEAHFDFCGMHVDINFIVGHFQEEQRRGENVAGEYVAVGFVNGVENQAIAYQAAIDENVDAVAIGALDFRARGETVHGEAGFFFGGLELRFGDGGAKGGGDGGHFDQFVEGLLAEKLVDALGEVLDGGAVDDLLRGRGEDKLAAGIGQRVVGDQRSDVAQFGGFGFQEFAARGDAVEQIGDADGGSQRKTRWFYADQLAAGEFYAGALGVFFGARLQEQAGDSGDGGQGFAAKAERGDGEQVFGGAQLAGGVALEGQQRVVVSHAVAVVEDANHALAAGFDFHANRFRGGIERVFEQLLDYGGGPLNNFARGNAVSDSLRQNTDPAHTPRSLGGRSFSSDISKGRSWALAPEAACKNFAGIGSKVSLPLAEE